MRRLTALVLALLGQAAAVSVQLQPLPFQTVRLGGGVYSVLDQPGLRVIAYSDTPLEIASTPDTPGKVSVDLNHLPVGTQKTGPNTYVLTTGGVTLMIQSAAPRQILAPPEAATPTTGSLTREVREQGLARLPGLPSDITGSINAVQTRGQLVLSYSLINLGGKSYSLDVDDLSVTQAGVGIGARLERKNGSLTPGLLSAGKGEIGRITIPRVSSAPITLRWTLRSGDVAYTLVQTYPLILAP